jgi:hypothetical protein
VVAAVDAPIAATTATAIAAHAAIAAMFNTMISRKMIRSIPMT